MTLFILTKFDVQASNECTTVIVAHRLSTVRKADRIVVISEGQVLEQGSHNELIKKRGAYFELVTAQISEQDENDNEIEDEDDELPPMDNSMLPQQPRFSISRQKSIDLSNGKSPSFIPPNPDEVSKI